MTAKDITKARVMQWLRENCTTISLPTVDILELVDERDDWKRRAIQLGYKEGDEDYCG